MAGKDRHLAVAAELHRALSEILHELWVSDEGTLLTITKVVSTPDLGEAFVFFNFLPSAHIQENTIKLHHLTKFVRKELAKRVVARRVPKIIWRYDDEGDKADAIFALLDSVKHADEESIP